MPHKTSHLERLASTLVASVGNDGLIPELARRFAEAVDAQVVEIRTRDGDVLSTSAAYGFAATEPRVHAHPVALLESVAPDSGPTRLAFPDDDGLVGQAILAEHVSTVHALPLRRGDECEGVVLLGWRDETSLDDAQRNLLASLAAPVGAALLLHRVCAERDAALARAERALALRDEILGIVAHDLRNPLNVITTATELLQRRTDDPAQQRHFERIMRSVQRAERMVRDLLEVNAMEGGGIVLERGPVEVVEAVLAAIESQYALAAGVSVVLATDLDPALPPIDADPQRIQEVLENLISNAIKFSHRGSSVVVGAALHGKEVQIWVRDRGEGIAVEHLPNVFDRFWQGLRRDTRGAGLGLAICRTIVDAHGGSIWAESVHGRGTTMRFTVPVAPPPVMASDPPPATILLVDDRPENLVALSAILDDPRYRLVCVTRGEDALREALRNELALALVDVAMPGMDGFALVAQLRKLARCRDVPVIFVTAFGGDPSDVHRAYAAGGADYLVKPLDPELVRKKVAVFVELVRRQRGLRAAG